MFFLFAKVQMYVGLGFSGELGNRPLKKLKVRELDITDFIVQPPRQDNAAGDYSRDYDVNDWYRTYIGVLKFGVNTYVKCGWNAMFETNLHLLNTDGFSGNVKVLARHRVGFFIGLGAEYGYMWNVRHQVKSSGGQLEAVEGGKLKESKSSVFKEYAILKMADKTLSCHEVYGVATVGTQTELGCSVALQVEGQVLVGFSSEYKTPKVTLERKSLGEKQDKTEHEFTYGWPIKLRAMASVVKFI